MEIKDKIVKALSRVLEIEYVRLDEEGRISGHVVSPTFQKLSSLARQELIDDALKTGPDALTRPERRRVVMIAALTPMEYLSVGTPIRIQLVRERAGNTVEILLDGGLSDAEYVREKLNDQKGVQTTKPRLVRIPGVSGTRTAFRAKGTETSPLTKAKTLRVLKKDPYIEVMSHKSTTEE